MQSIQWLGSWFVVQTVYADERCDVDEIRQLLDKPDEEEPQHIL